MKPEVLDDFDIEKQCSDHFAQNLEVTEVIVRDVPTSTAAYATVFKANNGQVYAYITSQGVQLLDDVKKSIQRMQCEADTFLPPHGEQGYFDRIAHQKFKAMFPGKPIVGEDDLRYYRNIASYNPALVVLNRIKGEIRGFDSRAKMWRKVKDVSYNKIAPK
ncbi:MAG TPA: hypothetical protein VFT87_00490 [Candidatus Saccharimonadales bacterium]|nr:hypothetical protein [Candidatus Saccharimonadales bacterium]